MWKILDYLQKNLIWTIPAMMLAALLPTSGMTITWTGFAKGDINAAIKMTVIGLVAGSIATPFYVQSLMGTVIEIPMLQVFKQIALIVFIPMVLGNLTQKGLIRKYGQECWPTFYRSPSCIFSLCWKIQVKPPREHRDE